MLRRDSCKSKRQTRGLSRSKSSCSTHTSATAVDSLRHINPSIARRDAHIAALLSYSRSQRRSTETDNHTDMSIYDTTIPGYGETTNREAVANSRGEDDTPRLYRKQSIRYIGHGTGRPLSTGTASAITGSIPRNSKSTIQLSYRGSLINQTASTGNPTALDYVDRPTFLENIPPPRDDDITHSTSCRRVKKAKSMFESFAQPRSSYYFNNELPIKPGMCSNRASPNRSLNRENRSIHQAEDADEPRMPTSMSFLRNSSRGSHVPSRVASRQGNDLAIRMAEDVFRQEIKHQREQTTSNSSIFRKPSLNQRTNLKGAMRKTFRSSINSADIAPISDSTNSKFRQRARNVSRSLKNKIKDVFHLQKGNTVPTCRTVSGPHHPSDQSDHKAEDDKDLTEPVTLSYADEASISQGPSRVPNLYNVPSDQQLRSSRGSMDNVGSSQDVADGEEESVRILSWTTSGANSINSQAPPPLESTDPAISEFERQRLSVIKENGVRVASPSLHRKPSRGLHPEQEDINATPCAQKRPTIDSRRVCSALIKRLEEASGYEPRRENMDQGMEGFKLCNASSPLDSSICQSVGPSLSSPTIRCVTPAMYAFEDTTTSKDLHTRPNWIMSHQQPPSRARQISESISESVLAHQQPGDASSVENHAAGCRSDFGRSSPTKSLTDRSSAFFGSPSCHLFRTTSPYRRALREKMEADQAPEHQNRYPDTQPELSTSDISLPTRCQSTQPSQRDVHLDFSGSVYSDASVSEGEEGGGHETTAHGAEDRSTVPHKPQSLGNREPPSWKSRLTSGIERLKSTSASDSRRREKKETTIINDDGLGSPNHNFVSDASPLPPPTPTRISPVNYHPREDCSDSLIRDDESSGSQGPVHATFPLHIRPLNTHRLQNNYGLVERDDENAARKQQLLIQTEAVSVVSSPGLTTAVEKIFGTLNQERSSENTVPRMSPMDASQGARTRYPASIPRDGSYVRVSTGREAPSQDTNTNGQAEDSKKMVNIFLNSRRRRLAGSEDSSAFL